jgi:hypothetical protein
MRAQGEPAGQPTNIGREYRRASRSWLPAARSLERATFSTHMHHPANVPMKQALLRLLRTSPSVGAACVAREVIVFWLVCTVPTIALLTCLSWAFPELFASGAERSARLLSLRHAVGAVAIGPVIETLGLALTIWSLRKALAPDRTLLVVVLSSAIWALLHALEALGWGLAVFWPFLVFATAFVRWESKGLLPAITVTSLVHALHNASAVLISALAPLL